MCMARLTDAALKVDPISRRIEKDYGYRPKSLGQVLGIEEQAKNKYYQPGGGGYTGPTRRA